MEKYWPYAIIRNTYKDNKSNELFTYDPCNTIEEAIETIRGWHKHYSYNIDTAWIEKEVNSERICIEVDYAPIKYTENPFA